MSNICVYCENEISNCGFASIGGDNFHHKCYDEYMEELNSVQPIETDWPAYPDCYDEYGDCEPNPYHGDYSEM